MDHCQKEWVQKGGNELCSRYEETERKGGEERRDEVAHGPDIELNITCEI